jgi:16S rRNA (adenine1518-N6/adenine1519-N6)-dimethyltransferase
VGKRLSQIALANRRVAVRIVEQLDLTAGDTVIELGAGGGALTEALRGPDVRVLAIEIDLVLCKRLRARWPELWVLCQDLLHFDFAKVPLALTRKPKLVANLPYHISGPSLMHIASHAASWERAVVTVQREVANRLVASPHSRDYGRLTLLVGRTARARVLFPIVPGSFRPRPKVHSAVVELLPRLRPLVPNELLRSYRAVVRGAFVHRRKMLKNTAVGRAVAGRGVDHLLGRRPEQLAIEDFVSLARAYRMAAS